MSAPSAAPSKGLEGVVIGQSQLSIVDGEVGRLIYRGYEIQDLAANATFEEVAHLLWFGKLPTQAELDDLSQKLRAEQQVPPAILDMLPRFPKEAHPMGVLRTTVSALGIFDPEAEDNSPEANQRKAIRLTAQTPVLVAAWDRVRKGEQPVPPRGDLSLAENFLYMLTGKAPGKAQVDALNAYFVLLTEHEMNASTFSSRVTTSTLSDIYSAITSAVGTLKGPAHGGANEIAMRQFMDIGTVENVDAWFDNLIANKGRIMGIGHRVYKALDPRAGVLRERAEAIAHNDPEQRLWFDIAAKLEDRARAHEYFIERKLYPNVDYYSAIVLASCGIDVDQFTPLFAISRMVGWTAHVMEQWTDNRLIRPRVDYVGPDGLKWQPIDQRS